MKFRGKHNTILDQFFRFKLSRCKSLHGEAFFTCVSNPLLYLTEYLLNKDKEFGPGAVGPCLCGAEVFCDMGTFNKLWHKTVSSRSHWNALVTVCSFLLSFFNLYR